MRILVSVPAPALPMQFCVGVLGKVTGNGAISWTPATCVGDLAKAPGMQPDPAQATVSTWGENQQHEILSCFSDSSSLAVTFSFGQIHVLFHFVF